MKNNLFKKTYPVLVMLFVALFALSQQANAQSKEAYVQKDLDSKVMTFYYDDQKANRKGIIYDINAKQTLESGAEIPVWAGNSQNEEKTTTRITLGLERGMNLKQRCSRRSSMLRSRTISQQTQATGLATI